MTGPQARRATNSDTIGFWPCAAAERRGPGRLELATKAVWRPGPRRLRQIRRQLAELVREARVADESVVLLLGLGEQLERCLPVKMRDGLSERCAAGVHLVPTTLRTHWSLGIAASQKGPGREPPLFSGGRGSSAAPERSSRSGTSATHSLRTVRWTRRSPVSGGSSISSPQMPPPTHRSVTPCPARAAMTQPSRNSDRPSTSTPNRLISVPDSASPYSTSAGSMRRSSRRERRSGSIPPTSPAITCSAWRLFNKGVLHKEAARSSAFLLEAIRLDPECAPAHSKPSERS